MNSETMPQDRMPVGRDFYLSRKPAGAQRATITHHRTVSRNFLHMLQDMEDREVKGGRKKVADELKEVTETEYRMANGMKEITRT